jgi:hypothetical protein
MRKAIYQELDLQDREAQLRSECYEMHRDQPIRRQFTEEELIEKNKQYVKDSLEYSRLKAEYDYEISNMKKILKSKQEELELILSIIDRSYEDTKGDVFLFDNQAEGKMYIYDALGNLVDTRPLKQTERQISFISHSKAV